jgi:hypothetical protein
MSEPTATAGPPAVVLRYGAFADASSWNGVIKPLPTQTVPVTGAANSLRRVSTDSAYIEKFSGAYSHRVLEGIGHNVPQEARGAFTDAIVKVGGGLS